MAGRRQLRRAGAADFRPSPPSAAGRTPSRRQAVALLTGLALVAAGIAIVSFVVKPSTARSFDLFYGSMYIDDNTSPVAIDLASGKPSVRLANAFTAVSAKSAADIAVYPLGGGNTLMLDTSSGEFNMVDSTGFVVKPSDGGVTLPRIAASTTSSAVRSGSSAYILRTSPGATSVYLVGASTVAAAVGSHARAKARAYATLAQRLSGDPVPAADAGGNLWVLTAATGETRRVTELSVPHGSNAGVTLSATAHGTVSGPAAVAAATMNGDGSGGEVAAVATTGSVQVYGPDASHGIAVPGLADADTILSATNAQGVLVFLYHSPRGWSRVTVPTSGKGQATVSALTAIPADARLVRPAQSNGRTFTMDTTGNGALWQITGGAERVAGVSSYPLKRAERPQLADAEVLADGDRVIFNSRANLRAVVVFSDDSHAPRVVDKHSAVQLDPSGATALADAHATGKTDHGKPTQKPPRTRRPTQTINEKINCKTTKQVPHIPTLVAGDRASRSIELTWIYPLLDPSDCIPSTYVVAIKVLSSDAPHPPSGQVTVQGQNGVTLTQLFPATTYELSVTAYLNQQSSTSQPIRVTTGPEGPAAPTGVKATTDSSGNWTVSWNSCGGIQQGCVPSASWYVIPHFCDGRGLSNVPARLTVPGDPTVHSFSQVYPGGDALLGRALCFQVQGISPSGTVGTTSGSTAPAYSWGPPDAGALTINASQPADTALGASATTTVDLDLGANPVHTVGGIGATITFRLSGPDGTQTKPVTWDGRSARESVSFTGIQAGQQYTAQASVAPPNHPAAAVTTRPVTVVTRAQWPALSADASCPPAGGPVTLSCTLTVQLSGPSSAQANGETFDLLDSGVVCGNSGFPLNRSGFDPARDPITQSVDLLQYNGSCTVTLRLVESAGGTGPKVFGGTTSPVITRTVDLGQASSLGADKSDFTVDWASRTDGLGNKIASAQVAYTGQLTNAQVGQLSYGWSETLTAPDGTQCGAAGAQPTHEGIFVDVSGPCLNNFGAQPNWQLALSYTNRSNNVGRSFSYTISGTPPNYIPPCTISESNFIAKWAGTFDAPSVTVDFSSQGSALQGCSNWSYVLRSSLGQNCGSPTGNPAPDSGQIVIPVDKQCDPTTLAAAWQVVITYDSARNDSRPLVVPIQGQPPQPPPSPTPDPSPSPTTT
jgi:hypothetical protein